MKHSQQVGQHLTLTLTQSQSVGHISSLPFTMKYTISQTHNQRMGQHLTLTLKHEANSGSISHLYHETQRKLVDQHLNFG